MLGRQLRWKYYNYFLRLSKRLVHNLRSQSPFCGRTNHLSGTSRNDLRTPVTLQPPSQTCASLCTKPTSSSSTEDGVEAEEPFAELETELDSEFSPAAAGGEDEVHLRINLYPGEKDPVLSQLNEATSVAQVFEIIKSLDPGSKDVRHTSQALVTLWDIQKFLYRIGPVFNPEKEFANRSSFIESLTSHPSFRELILDPLVANAGVLGDEPLVAVLLTLKRMNWNLRSRECQVLIQECARRKETFDLPALSRLCVCMRTEGLYGCLMFLDFLPLLMTYIQGMSDDSSVRLISISLRNMQRALPPSTVQLYRERLSQILDRTPLQSVTYCKVLLCLLDTRSVPALRYESSPQHLFRAVGRLITPQVKDMDLLEVLSLQRVLEFGSHEPSQFVDALHGRISRFIEEQEETPRLDLLACIAPFVSRSIEQRRRLASFVQDYLDSYPNFDVIAHVLLKILRILKINDSGLYDKFWSRATQLVNLESADVRKVLRLAGDYLGFNFGLSYAYRHEDFEARTRRILYFYLENFRSGSQPSMMAPGDFARVYAFLLAFGSPVDPIFLESSHGFLDLFDRQFAGQCRVQELCTLARGICTSLFYHRNSPRTPRKYFDQIMDFSSVLEETVSSKLLDGHGEDLSSLDLVAISKLHLSLKRPFGDSPLFQESVGRWTRTCSPMTMDARLGREMALTLISARYNSPQVFSLLKGFILQHPDSVTSDFAAKFLCLGYTIGYETETAEDTAVFNTCYNVLERNWEKFGSLTLLQSGIALAYFRSLQTGLIHNIFSPEFLDEVDQELGTSFAAGSYPLRVRNAFMQLNRAVCLDVPGANVPWFHKKFCEDLFSIRNMQGNYLQQEVHNVLTEVLNDSAAIQKNAYSPYFYLIHFLIEFDRNGKPIKRKPRSNRLFSLSNLTSVLTPEESVEVKERVAVILLPPSAFTKNVRTVKGFYKLRVRHLEILGYRVVLIDPQHWNTMFMSEPYAKNDFIEGAIFPPAFRDRDAENKVHVEVV